MWKLTMHDLQRNPLMDTDNASWFNIFTISESGATCLYLVLKTLVEVFELVSAYGTVGLSLGLPYVRALSPSIVCVLASLKNYCQANYSFSGSLHTLSKLILCAVMIRGRHRGLPVAIDRAVMFPTEFKLEVEDDSNDAAISHLHSTGRVDEKSLNAESFDLRQRSSRHHDEEAEMNPRTSVHEDV